MNYNAGLYDMLAPEASCSLEKKFHDNAEDRAS
jgi:hypothetical protein